MLRATINEKAHEFQEGLSILQTLRFAEIDVPTPCDDERLTPFSLCLTGTRW